jgi:ectoine hydroxylase-related dioxygenase (phytanoyl-CoA dioxygenase family)
MSNALVERYNEQGYAVVEGLLSMDEVETIRAEGVRVCEEHIADLKPGESPESAAESALCIHFPHKLSPRFRDAMAHPRVVELLNQFIGPNVKCMQSMLFFKHAGKPGQAWHQDEAFIPTRDRSLTAAWIALDDATIDNGCLWVLPGTHKPGVLWPLHDHNNPEYDSAREAYGFPERDEDAIPVEVKAGTAVFFNGYLLHKSLRNRRTQGYRRALVNHYMSAESLLPWDCGRQVPLAHDNRDIVLVSGVDPYAYKGTVDQHRAYVRREVSVPREQAGERSLASAMA